MTENQEKQPIIYEELVQPQQQQEFVDNNNQNISPQQQTELTKMFYELLKSTNFQIKLFDVNPESLQTLKVLIQNHKEQSKTKEKTEYIVSNVLLQNRVRKLEDANRQLREKLEDCAKNKGRTGSHEGANSSKKRRKRKLKAEVERNFACKYSGCTKAYGFFNKY